MQSIDAKKLNSNSYVDFLKELNRVTDVDKMMPSPPYCSLMTNFITNFYGKPVTSYIHCEEATIPEQQKKKIYVFIFEDDLVITNWFNKEEEDYLKMENPILYCIKYTTVIYNILTNYYYLLVI